MASIKLISENEAQGKTLEIFRDIKATLGIDFVPNLYRVMAGKPDYLEANWNKVKAVMIQSGKLDSLTRGIIGSLFPPLWTANTDYRYILLRCRSLDWMTKGYSN